MASQLQGQERRDFFLMAGSQLLMYCSFFSFLIFPLFIKNLGGDERTIGLIMGAQSLASVIVMPWQGPLLGQLRVKKIMLTGMMVMALSIAACFTLTAPGVWMAVLLVLRGLSFSFFQNGGGIYTARIIPKHERAHWLGMTFGVNQVAMAIGPFLGDIIARNFGFPGLFVFSASLIAGAWLLMLPVTDYPPERPDQNFQLARAGQQFFQALSKPSLIFIFMSLLLMAFGLGGVFNFTATYAVGLGLSPGIFFLLYSLVTAGFRLMGSGLSDRFGRTIVIVPFILIYALGVFFLSMTESTTMLVISGIVVGLGFSLVNPTITAQMLDQTPTPQHGTAIVGFHFAYQAGMMVATPIVGLLAKGLGYRPMWWILVAVIASATLAYLAGEWHRNRQGGSYSQGS